MTKITYEMIETQMEKIAEAQEAIAKVAAQRMGVISGGPSIEEENAVFDRLFDRLLEMARECEPRVLRRAWFYCDSRVITSELEEIARDRGITL